MSCLPRYAKGRIRKKGEKDTYRNRRMEGGEVYREERMGRVKEVGRKSWKE